MVALRPEYICAVWLWLYLSSPPSLFSLARGQESQDLDGCQKRPACRAAETFTSQAGRDAGSDPRRKAKEKKWEIILNSIFYSACFCFLSCPLLKPNCICPPSLAGGNCRVGRLYSMEDWGGDRRVGGALGSESSAEERNKCINNKEDMTSGGGAVQHAGWVCASMEEPDCTHIRVRLCTVWMCAAPLSRLWEKTRAEFKQSSWTLFLWWVSKGWEDPVGTRVCVCVCVFGCFTEAATRFNNYSSKCSLNDQKKHTLLNLKSDSNPVF